MSGELLKNLTGYGRTTGHILMVLLISGSTIADTERFFGQIFITLSDGDIQMGMVRQIVKNAVRIVFQK